MLKSILFMSGAVLLLSMNTSAQAAEHELFSTPGQYIECRSTDLQEVRKIRISRTSSGYSVRADVNDLLVKNNLKDQLGKATASLKSILIDDAFDGDDGQSIRIHADTFNNKSHEGNYAIGIRLALSLTSELRGQAEFQKDFQNRKTGWEERDQFLFGPTYGTVGNVVCTSNSSLGGN